MPRSRVLVVDDNRDAADTLAGVFELLGYDARAEYDGQAGLAAARDFRPDVCVLDIHMPGMDGCELAEALRSEFDPRVRLIAVTGVTGGEYDERIRHAGFDARFPKPADIPSLLTAMSAGPPS